VENCLLRQRTAGQPIPPQRREPQRLRRHVTGGRTIGRSESDRQILHR
jgi:hypothetical protein